MKNLVADQLEYFAIIEFRIIFQLGITLYIPVTITRRILRLQMGKRPSDMEGSCEYIE
jgi:hypothetical protein